MCCCAFAPFVRWLSFGAQLHPRSTLRADGSALKRGAVLPCEPCADRTFRLARYRERTFNVLSKSMRNEKDDIFCAGERESPARMRKFEGVKQFPKLRLS